MQKIASSSQLEIYQTGLVTHEDKSIFFTGKNAKYSQYQEKYIFMFLKWIFHPNFEANSVHNEWY